MGWDILKTLKENKLTKHIPVIITSMDYEPQHAMSLGANGVIEKPITVDNLRKVLCAKYASRKNRLLKTDH